MQRNDDHFAAALEEERESYLAKDPPRLHRAYEVEQELKQLGVKIDKPITKADADKAKELERA